MLESELQARMNNIDIDARVEAQTRAIMESLEPEGVCNTAVIWLSVFSRQSGYLTSSRRLIWNICALSTLLSILLCQSHVSSAAVSCRYSPLPGLVSLQEAPAAAALLPPPPHPPPPPPPPPPLLLPQPPPLAPSQGEGGRS